jgi:DNA-binding transcriptional LysR family regulator
MPSIDFDLRQLEIFCKVIEMQSFSKAADSVFLTQASVSERISNLERMIGVRLLDRLGRQVMPTKAGELLYRHAIRLLDMKKTARQEMEGFLGLKQGELHIGGSTIPGEYILPKKIGLFREKYPFVSITLIVADTGEIENLVLNGDLELGVIGSRSSSENLLHYNLWKDELVLTIAADHRWSNKRSITLKELSEEPFILRESGSATLKTMDGYLRDAGHSGTNALNVIACFGTSTSVKEGIKSGLGVSILSKWALETEINAGILKTVRVKGLPAMKRTFYLIRDRRRIASPLCQAMLEFLRASPSSAS